MSRTRRKIQHAICIREFRSYAIQKGEIATHEELTENGQVPRNRHTVRANSLPNPWDWISEREPAALRELIHG